jgi:Tfp pilus assembly protein PilF
MHSKSLGTAALLAACSLHALAAPAGLDATIVDLTHRWAKVTYQTTKTQQDEGYKSLILAAEQAEQAFPGSAEPLVWKAIALSSAAKVEGGLTGLSKAKQAKELLLNAEKIDPGALSGSIYSSLGTLYAKVPGWPIGFGDKTKAAAYLKQALAINPNGIDPNFFYGEFLSDQGHYAEATDYINRALAAPARPGREDSDSGRRLEARALAEALRKKQSSQADSQ